MKKRYLRLGAMLLLAVLVAGLIIGCGRKAPEQATEGQAKAPAGSAEEFLAGKNVDLIVPYSTGGGYDTYARMIAPYIEKYSKATVVVRNVPGGGGLVGTNQLYVSNPDGLTIGILNGMAIVTSQALGSKGVQYDSTKFSWLARVNADPRVMVVAANGPYKTFDDVLQTKKPFTFGVSGAGSDEAYLAAAVVAAFGFPAKIVTGYPGQAETQLAMLRGEVDGNMASLGSRMSVIKSGEAKVLLHLGRQSIPELPGVPAASELAPKSKVAEAQAILEATTSLSEVGRLLAAPPGVPEDRLRVWREVVRKALSDPELIKLSTESDRPINYLPGEEVAKLVASALNMPQVLKDALKSQAPKE